MLFEVPSLESLNLGVTLPAVSLAFGVCVLLLADLLLVPKDRKEITAWLAVAGVAVSFVLNLFTFNNTDNEAFLGMFVADSFTGFMNIVILLTAFLGILLSKDYLKRAGIERGEYYTLMLMSAAGMMFMASANDLVVVFIALELLSIPLYVLAAFRVPDVKSEESGMKYFILGAFSSAFFVYGAALVYGATGTTSLPAIFNAVGTLAESGGSSAFLLLAGAGLILVGLGFKVAVVPFHMWTPDVYEGAPTPVTAFMSVGAKAGGFAALLRIMAMSLPAFTLADGQTFAAWQQTFWIIAALTLILGNLVAIAQSNIKRMLAYSSIAHAGYILMAVAASGTIGLTDEATRAALIYLLAYMFTNLGAFGVALAVERDDGSGTNLNDFVGLAKNRPGLALMMAVFMLSLTGIPLTGGFIGKWFVFKATLDAGLVALAIIGVLTSVVSAFYYVRVIVNMYLRDGEAETPGETQMVNWAVYIAGAGTLIMGIFPFLVTGLSDLVTVAASVVR
ncbi:MAG: NADH-quinone oxidoreductase subunit N [Chloroflexi bacterium]|nr:NADH-quinone oxidoreductase subunit N [Chloroflexota bacterium]